MRCFALFAVIATQIHLTIAHTWVERLRVIAPNGTFVGDSGFPRGNVLRTSPGFSDVPMTHLIGPTLNQGAQMCSGTQQEPVQTNGSPRLEAAAGSFVALQYQENGHVTLPNNQPGKPANRGTVYIYGTSEPQKNEDFTAIFKIWNADGTGGDKRGKLLATQNFDDGQCYQTNPGNISVARKTEFPKKADTLQGTDLWCQNDIALPKDLATGKPYTIYWVWDWPTASGVDPNLPNGKTEIYTTCMDIDIVAGAPRDAAAQAAEAIDPPIGDGAVPSIFKSLLADSSPSTGPHPQQPANTSRPVASAAPTPPSSPEPSVRTVFRTIYITGPAPGPTGRPSHPGRSSTRLRPVTFTG
ncbi:hypothetical protein FGG08_002102 [Glutinoglossum americanum]|uniref:DUF7492 domain-containing protein n=1 Tax=Glutinoglossum americanum TaxID=1670608 RepID=A0A9P8I6U9_9PEZI|nr:hypothetical protein FGG08_002102 [Glutinoglossum americanum]